MAKYQISLKKSSGEVLEIKISKQGRTIIAHVSGDEIAQWIIERGGLTENLVPPEKAVEATNDT